MNREVVYKLCEATAWAGAEAEGCFAGSDDDRRDGYVHLATGAQLPGVLGRHFGGRRALVIVGFSAAQLGPALRWERNGADVFPHFYGRLPTTLVFGPAALPEAPEARAALLRALT